MLVAGFLSIILYRHRCPGTRLTVGMGIRLGAISGAVGFCALVIFLGLAAAFRSGAEIHEAILKFVQQYAAHSPDPRMEQVLELFSTPGGFVLMMVMSLVMTLVAFLILSGIGGALGAALLRRKERL